MKKRILVVEDNETNMYLMRYMLSTSGYEVLEARDGETGVKRTLEELPDQVFMDMQLPLVDGYEATRQIRRSSAGASIPIIAITSCAMTGDREIIMEAGCTAYVEKPINPEFILSEITTWLETPPKPWQDTP